MSEQKNTLREKLRKSRNSRKDVEKSVPGLLDNALFMTKSRKKVALYESVNNEPSTKELIVELQKLGVELVIAPTDPESSPSEFAKKLSDVDLIIVPALAASMDGRRLGQGGGWYDKALAEFKKVRKTSDKKVAIFAMVYDDEVLDTGEIPLEDHDMIVDAIITPNAVLTCLMKWTNNRT
jgi:5-formyltetrahydrofolate cyclo-ligase